MWRGAWTSLRVMEGRIGRDPKRGKYAGIFAKNRKGKGRGKDWMEMRGNGLAISNHADQEACMSQDAGRAEVGLKRCWRAVRSSYKRCIAGV